VFSDIKANKKIYLASFSCIITVLLIQAILPRIQTEEGHQYFIPTGDQSVYQIGLPPQVYNKVQHLFSTTYPKKDWCDQQKYGCWRYNEGPKRPFAFSPDALFISPLYSRIVDDINFADYISFNAGFANTKVGMDGDTNWYKQYGPLSRLNIPFYLMYQISDSLIGNELCIEGHVFWPTPSEDLQYNHYDKKECRTITEDISNKKIYALSIGEKPLSLSLKKKYIYTISNIALIITKLSALFVLLFYTLNFHIKSQLEHIWLFGLSAIQTLIYKFQDFRYPLFAGGSDGLTHYAYGKNILESLLKFDFHNALIGAETTYYFMPGLRYFRAFEMLIFGNSAFGYWIVILFFASIYFFLASRFFERKTAFKISLFLVLPLSPWHLHALFGEARKGLPEALGYLLFIFGIATILWLIEKSANYKYGIFGWICLSLSIIIRPNLCISGFIFCCLIGLKYLRTKKFLEILMLIIGMSPTFLPLLHNVYFGNEWVVFTSASTIPENLRCPPMIYLRALIFLIQGKLSPELFKVSDHLLEWTQYSPVLAILFIIQLVVIFMKKTTWPIRNLALTGLGLHVVLFFWKPGGRWSILAWQFTFIVFFYVAICYFRTAHYQNKIKPMIQKLGFFIRWPFNHGRFDQK
jgi:hypothetical protein